MPIDSNTLRAVVMGEISGLRAIDKDMQKIIQNKISSAVDRWKLIFPDVLNDGIDFFGGNKWVSLLLKPRLSLRFALFIRATLKANERLSLETRISIAINTVEFVPNMNPLGGCGKAFSESAHGLDSLRRERNMHFLMESPKLRVKMNQVVHLTDDLATSWTNQQALTVTAALTGLSINKIASQQCKSRKAISDLLRKASWYDIEQALKIYESTIGPIKRNI